MMCEKFPKQTKMSNRLSDRRKLHADTQFFQLFKGKLYSHQYLLSLNLSTAHVDVRDVAVSKRRSLQPLNLNTLHFGLANTF